MEAGNILSADVLDIIFEARNKEYGAYDLRKNYQRRLTKSLAVTFLLVVLVCTVYILFGSMKPPGGIIPGGCVLTLVEVSPPPVKPDPLPPVFRQPEPPKIKMNIFMIPVIAPDEDIPYDKPLAAQDDMADAKIGNADVDGKASEGIQAPVDEAKAVVEVPKKQDTDDGGFVPVEIESQYPGGVSAWSAFLNRNLIYPQDAADIDIQGTVYVQFVVDAEGNISNVTALSGPEELRSSAVAVIKKSGKWTPALQNGRYVKSYKKQPITFRLE